MNMGFLLVRRSHQALAVAVSLLHSGQSLHGQQPPFITFQPSDQTAIAGTTAGFAVGAGGSAPLGYRWFRFGNGTLLSTQTSLLLTNVQPGDAGYYFVQVTNPVSATASRYAQLIVYTPPTITAQPTSQSLAAGTDATFTVAASGFPTPSYQWRLNDVDLAGATTNVLSLTNVQVRDEGGYTVVVSNVAGTVTSLPASLTVSPAAPLAKVRLGNRIVIEGTTAALDATSYGSEPLRYQWYFNGSEILGATNPTLTLTDFQAGDAGGYRVTTTNEFGSITSRTATLRSRRYPKPSLTVVAWGDNTYGQTNLPSGETNIVAVAAGAFATVALRQDGTILDFGGYPFRLDYTPFTGIVEIDAQATGAARTYGLALRNDGRPIGFGLTGFAGESDVPSDVTNIVAITTGEMRLALRDDGTGTGWPSRLSIDRYNVIGLFGSMSGISDIASSEFHALALRSNGTVMAWGSLSNVPLNLNNVVAISAGENHNLALKANGTVVAWGDNSLGQTNVPPDLAGVEAISAGVKHSLALKSNGTVVAWGDNSFGQCNVPPNLSNVVAVSAGDHHSVALTKHPGVAVQPMATSVFAASEATLTVVVTGHGPHMYQWQFNGTNIVGATNSSLTWTSVPLTAAGTYECVISTPFGSVTTREVTLAVTRPALEFDSVLFDPAGDGVGFGSRLKGLSAHGEFVIFVSTNLIDWVPILTNPPVLGSYLFTDPTATNTLWRFYRAIEE